MPRILWLGASDEEEEDVWRWTDGGVMSYTKWGEGEPNFGILENCLVLKVDDNYWNNINCGETRPFICQWRE